MKARNEFLTVQPMAQAGYSFLFLFMMSDRQKPEGIIYCKLRTLSSVNYPLSKANGLPASSTSKPDMSGLTTISTSVNSGWTIPIYVSSFMLFVADLLPIYSLQHWCLYHVSICTLGISIPLWINLLCLYSDTHRLRISGCLHRMNLFWCTVFHSTPPYILTVLLIRTTIHLILILPNDDFLPYFLSVSSLKLPLGFRW